MNPLNLPWHLAPTDNGVGCDVVNVAGELVAAFEHHADADAVVERMNRDWVASQPWFKAFIQDATAMRRDAH